MEPAGSMPNSQGFSSNAYPDPNQTQFLVLIPISLRSILVMSSHLRLGLPKGIFPIGLPVKILKAVLPSSILATWPAHLNLLDLITLTAVWSRHELWVCFQLIILFEYHINVKCEVSLLVVNKIADSVMTDGLVKVTSVSRGRFEHELAWEPG